MKSAVWLGLPRIFARSSKRSMPPGSGKFSRSEKEANFLFAEMQNGELPGEWSVAFQEISDEEFLGERLFYRVQSPG